MPASRPQQEVVRVHTPHIRSVVAPNGVIWVEDDRKDPPVFTLKNELELARYVHQHSSDDGFYAIGDLVHKAFETVGIKKPCLPCAERQARLNRLLRKPKTGDG